jgi:hypothetical protein
MNFFKRLFRKKKKREDVKTRSSYYGSSYWPSGGANYQDNSNSDIPYPVFISDLYPTPDNHSSQSSNFNFGGGDGGGGGATGSWDSNDDSSGSSYDNGSSYDSNSYDSGSYDSGSSSFD